MTEQYAFFLLVAFSALFVVAVALYYGGPEKDETPPPRKYKYEVVRNGQVIWGTDDKTEALQGKDWFDGEIREN